MVVPVQPVVVVPVIPVVPVVPIYAQPQIVVQTPPVVATPVQPVVPAPVVPAPATSAEVQALRQEVERLRGLLRPSAPREDEVVASNQARVTVILPADAKLWVDNVAVPLTSSVRTITTPTLNPNQRYHYTVKMEVVRNGRTLSQTQRVQLVPGATTQVEFNNASVVVAR